MKLINLKKYFIIFSGLLLFEGCQTYHITKEDLIKQFAKANSEQKHLPYPYTGLIFAFFTVAGNDLTEVTAYDKTGKPAIIHLTDHTGIRITKKDSSRVTFYFNTLEIKDSAITGSKSHFAEWRIKPIKLEDVVRIEIQK